MVQLIVGEYGFTLVVETGIDLTGYSLSLEVKKPGGREVQWAATQSSESPTKMEYRVAPGDLDEPGVYVLHARVYKSNVERFGKAASFLVREKFTLRP